MGVHADNRPGDAVFMWACFQVTVRRSPVNTYLRLTVYQTEKLTSLRFLIQWDWILQLWKLPFISNSYLQGKHYQECDLQVCDWQVHWWITLRWTRYSYFCRMALTSLSDPSVAATRTAQWFHWNECEGCSCWHGHDLGWDIVSKTAGSWLLRYERQINACKFIL